jgi:serine/threonine protein phosphatase PrpC
MESLISGKDVTASSDASGKNAFSEFFIFVRKGHEDCGDSAFAYSDEKKTIIAVFDGVSGEAGAANASTEAASAILEALKSENHADPKAVERAFIKAQEKITFGLTTAAVAFIEKTGAFVVAGVGDSPVYGVDKKGKITLELPLARAVKDGDAILKYFYYRNLLTSAIGQDSSGELAIRSGKLEKGEMLILASDGLSDNLYVKTKEGFVTDSSGCEDLADIARGKKTAESLANALSDETAKRISVGKIERHDSMLVPKEDDLSIAVIRML